MSNRHIVIIRNAAPQDFGGGERFPVFLSEILEKNNFNPIIVSRSQKLLSFAKSRDQQTIIGWWWKKQQWSGVNNLFFPLYLFWQAILYIYYRGLFKTMRPIAVHIQSKDDFIAATYAASHLGINVVWTDHADLKHIWRNVSQPLKNPIGKLVYRAAQRANSITVVSKSEEKLVKHNLPDKSSILSKIRVIYNGVSDSAHDYKQIKATDHNPFTFLVASRLVADKGINEVTTAFKKFHAEHPNTQLTIIGGGPESDIFKSHTKDTPSIHFLGHQADPLGFMASADVFVHPTYHEGFSVALVEASMMSLPIIATSVGGNVEIIKDKKTGILVKSKSTKSIYAAMRQLYEDSILRKKLSAGARYQYEKKFQFEHIVKESFIPLYLKGPIK